MTWKRLLKARPFVTQTCIRISKLTGGLDRVEHNTVVYGVKIMRVHTHFTHLLGVLTEELGV